MPHMGVGYRWLQGKPKELLCCWACCGYTLLPRGAVAQPAFVVVIDVVAIAAAASINKTREHCKQGEVGGDEESCAQTQP